MIELKDLLEDGEVIVRYVQMLEVICVGVIIWFACVDWGMQDYCQEDDDNLPAVMLFSVPVAILITIWMMNMGWIPFW